MVAVQPGAAALDVDQTTVSDDSAESTRHAGQPLALGGAAEDDQAGRGSLDVESGDIALDTEHNPAVLPVDTYLAAAEEAAASRE